MDIVTLKRKDLQLIEEALLETGEALSNIVQGYIWPTELNKSWTKGYNVITKAKKQKENVELDRLFKRFVRLKYKEDALDVEEAKQLLSGESEGSYIILRV